MKLELQFMEGGFQPVFAQTKTARQRRSNHRLQIADAERAWIKYNNKSIEDWIKVFGKNYLD